MLPPAVKLRHLDTGVRRLVINLNRIPGIDTCTTCEGHIWRNIPVWPTKDGWVHFVKRVGKHDGLVTEIQEFCATRDYFGLTEPAEMGPELELRTIEARYESHDNGSLFARLDQKGREEYFARAESRRTEILGSWKELNQAVVAYIKRELTPDFKSLPYR